MEESRRARTLAQERLRVRLEVSKEKAEQEQKTKEEDAQKKIRSLLSLQQNYDSALAELKASNERRSKREQVQNDARLQETVTLLSQGLNPYEVFRKREMTQRKQQELNRIAAMAVKRREDVRELVAEDVRHYNAQMKSRQRQETWPQRHRDARPTITVDEEVTSGDDDHASVENTALIRQRSAFRVATGQADTANLDSPASDNQHLPYKKVFSLNLPSVQVEKKTGGELYGLQSALSFASLASSAFPSSRSSIDFETSRSQLVSQRIDGDRVSRSVESSRAGKSSRKARPQKPLSILEQKMMERTMQSLKNNIVKKQVVMNKEFEGKSFITKPNILLFDDFEVGSSYTKKIIVTNVSLSFNTFKVLELPVRVSDFFKIVYAPPGRLSAGTGVSIDVTFTPVLPTPISERLVILAETGQFEIPIECLPKQCKVSLSTSCIEFDNISLGETQVRSVKILNNGGLESEVELSFDNESYSIDGNSETYIDLDGNNKSVHDIVQSAFVFGSIDALKPYSTRTLDVTFTPTILGTYTTAILFRYKGPDNSPTVTKLLLTGTVSDVPIYLSAREIDFHVCYCGQLYREALVLHNRGKIALKATVKAPPLLKKFVEFVPRVAFVQAHSSLSVQLKFKPTLELIDKPLAELMCTSPTAILDSMDVEHDENGSQNPTTETLVLDGMESKPNTTSNSALLSSCTISMPVTVDVASQSSPIWFQLKALVTNPILSVLPSSFEFGECSINESVSISFSVSNQSITPVRYGFVHLPKEIQIFPGDGFGTLMPLEEMKMAATFSPITATQHNFALTLKTDQGKSMTISCSGTGVKPALQFSPAIVAIPPTSLGDINTTSVFLENISKVPQIFEICVPVDCPFLQITPVVQTINPGSRAHIKLDFEPGIKLSEASNDSHAGDAIESPKPNGEQSSGSLKPRTYSRKTSSRTIDLTASSQDAAISHRGHKNTPLERKSKKKKLGSSVANLSEIAALSPKSDDTIQSASSPPPPRDVQVPQLPEGKPLVWKIPCFSKPAKLASAPKESQMTGESGIVVYLEISAVVAPPTLVRVLDPSERTSSSSPSSLSSFPFSPLAPNPPVDFGQVPIGQSVVKKITIKNNSPNEIRRLAAVYGNMTVLNAIRPMLPKQSQVLHIQYKPDSHAMHLETLSLLVGHHHRLVVPVQGQGVSPRVSLDPMPEDNCFDLGYTVAKDSCKKEFKLVNGSQFVVSYQIHLQRTGPKNLNGINPFSVIPCDGHVPVGGDQVITITFEPDHEIQAFYDELQIEVKSENSKRTIFLKGCCTGTRGLYMMEPVGDPLTIPASPFDGQLRRWGMGISDVIKPEYRGCIPRGSFALNFSASRNSHGPTARSLVFGNAKVKREKGITGEVIFEPLSAQAIKDGFSMEGGPRFTIEPDSTRTIEFKFDPEVNNPRLVSKNSNKEPNAPFGVVESLLQGTVETSIKCTLKGGYSPQDREGVSFTLVLVSGHCVGKVAM